MSEQFDKVKRERLLPQSHYDEAYPFYEGVLIDSEIDEILADPKEDEDHKQQLMWMRVYTSLELLICRYSAGDEVSSLRPYALRAFELFKAYRQRFSQSNRLLLWEPD